MTARWCPGCEQHLVDDPRMELCPSCADDQAKAHAAAVAAIGKHRTEESA